MKKTYIKLIKALVVLVLSLILMGICIYNYQLSAVSKDADTIEVTIEPGMSKQEISTFLEEKGLIRSSLFFNIYLRLNRIENLYASTYELSPNMGVKKIVSILEQGNNYNPNSIQITFPEGKICVKWLLLFLKIPITVMRKCSIRPMIQLIYKN